MLLLLFLNYARYKRGDAYGQVLYSCNIVFVVIYKVTENQRLDQLFTVKFS